MTEEEILQLWFSGYDKLKVAEMYKRRYNQQIKMIRLDIRNRHAKFITYTEALGRVEKIILKRVYDKK